MGDKQFRNENSGGARRKVKLGTVFWLTFIVLAPLFVLIHIIYRGENGLSKELEEAEIKKEVIKLLEDNNQIILRKALEKSLPQIEELKNKHLTEVKNGINQKLDAYFQERVISSGNVDRFLDELYSVKTGFAIISRKVKEIAEKFRNCRSLIKEVEEKKIGPNNLIDHECFKDPDDVDKYIEELFHKTVLSPQDLSGYVNKEIVPYLESKYSEFKKEAIGVVKVQYTEEAKRIIGEKYQNPEKFQNFIEESLRKSLEKTILKKIDSMGFAFEGVGKLLRYRAASIGARAASIGALFAFMLSKNMTEKAAIYYIINKKINEEFFTSDDLKTEVLSALNELKAEVGNSILENYKKQIESFESALAEELSKEIKIKDLGKQDS